MNPFLAQIISEAQEEFKNPRETVWGNKKDYQDLMECINWKNLYRNAYSFFNKKRMKKLLKEVVKNKKKIILTQNDLKQYIKFAQESVYSANGFNYDSKRDYIFEPYYFDKSNKDDAICRPKYSDCQFSAKESYALDYILGVKNYKIRYINEFANPFKTVKQEKMSVNELPDVRKNSFKEGTTTFKTILSFKSKARKYVAFPIIKHDSWIDYCGNKFDRVIFAVGCCPKLNYFADFCKNEGFNVQCKDSEIIIYGNINNSEV